MLNYYYTFYIKGNEVYYIFKIVNHKLTYKFSTLSFTLVIFPFILHILYENNSLRPKPLTHILTQLDVVKHYMQSPRQQQYPISPERGMRR